MKTKLLLAFQWLSLGLSLLLGREAAAQTDSTWLQSPEVAVSGFVDVFYTYDFNKPQESYRQPFLYNHNRHHEVNLNLGLVKVAVTHTKYRANLALQTGTYANDNYAAEPGVLKNIFEANAGLSLNPKNTLWLDAGVFSSHLGFESAISLDNWTLTRSLVAENSPYFLTGAKLTYSPTSQLDLVAVVCNGWQRIERLEGNSLLSFGTQVNYRPNESTTLNWSTFVGTDTPDSTRRMRYFNNVYGKFQLTSRFGLLTGFDLGLQQQAKNSARHDVWIGPVLIGRYTLNQKWAAALRAEYYQDKTGIIIPSQMPDGFKTSGLSLNLDYTPVPNVAARLEGRWFHSPDLLFRREDGFTDQNVFVTASLALRVGK
ncbi:porin [Rufibacter hautae]|uniref:Porin n=1 Tax=Rufibacter hautae TaxID=2595005 RepID=A0A5B6TU21_9BACT|nr:porin [Rufibacter hautae]KAA3440048.1 porin [Rufibacter hautae]